MNSFFLANRAQHDDSWTFCSSSGVKRQIDFIMHSSNINSSDAAPTTSLDMGSDHRAVRCRVQVPPITRRPRRKTCGLRGWLPDNPSSYHAILRDKLQQKQPDNILDLEDVVIASAMEVNAPSCRAPDLEEPWANDNFQLLLRRRRDCKTVAERARLSKQIRKVLRAHQRRKLNDKMTNILSSGRDFKRLESLLRTPEHSQQHRPEEVPSTEDFTSYLRGIFSTDSAWEQTSHSSFADILPFSLEELQAVLKRMKNQRGADDGGLVVEMFKFGGRDLHQCLLQIFNNMLASGRLESSWQHSLFKMLPKPGDSSMVANWRPIAVLKITYKIFSKLVHTRIQDLLEREQSWDQMGFRSLLGVDHALAVLDTVLSKAVEWNFDVWCASLDLKKAFDRIEFKPLFEALRCQGLPDCYISLLQTLYRSQSGSVKKGSPFDVERGVKQGDVMSPALFNAGLEHAFRQWKQRLMEHGLDVGAVERLTNIRYADDIMIYAKSWQELVYMIECLVQELGKIGLHLNASKSRIITTAHIDGPMYINVSDDMVEVLTAGDVHKYLRRHISADPRCRSQTELKHRFQVGWAKFRKHRHILTNKHVSIALRLKFFDTVLTPTVLFGLHVLPLTLSQIHTLDALQRRMLRSVVGWVRVANEDWHNTMSRMKHRLTAALHIHPVDTWSRQLARRQYNFAFQMLRIPNWAAAVVKWCPESNWQANFALQLHRRPGRPLTKWDDRLRSFAACNFPAVNTWTDIAETANWPPAASQYVQSFTNV